MAEPIREFRHRAMVNLRVPPDSAAAARIAAALGVELPAPNTVATGTHTVLWLGPDEWLVIGDGAREPLTSALGDDFGSVVDVSANRTTFVLSAPWARDVLEKGMAIDLHPSAFGPGQCAQTLLARAQVILQQVDDEPTYHVLVRGSFAPYLAAWLADAAGEFVG
jgi:sarcosine oxidase subunit gamma